MVQIRLATLALTAGALAAAGCGGGASKTSSQTTGASTSAAVATGPASTQTPAPPKKVTIVNVLTAGGPEGVTARMHLSTDHPRAHQPLSVDLMVAREGKPLKTEVRYEYVKQFANGLRVVGRGPHHHFNGNFHNVFDWPSLPVGFPLKFRAMIHTGKVTMNLDFPLKAS